MGKMCRKKCEVRLRGTPDFVGNTQNCIQVFVKTNQNRYGVYQKVRLNCKIYKINIEIPKPFVYNAVIAVPNRPLTFYFREATKA